MLLFQIQVKLVSPWWKLLLVAIDIFSSGNNILKIVAPCGGYHSFSSIEARVFCQSGLSVIFCCQVTKTFARSVWIFQSTSACFVIPYSLWMGWNGSWCSQALHKALLNASFFVVMSQVYFLYRVEHPLTVFWTQGDRGCTACIYVCPQVNTRVVKVSSFRVTYSLSQFKIPKIQVTTRFPRFKLQACCDSRLLWACWESRVLLVIAVSLTQHLLSKLSLSSVKSTLLCHDDQVKILMPSFQLSSFVCQVLQVEPIVMDASLPAWSQIRMLLLCLWECALEYTDAFWVQLHS